MARRTIEGLRTIVTGASSGIGRALVLELIRQGARVVALARRAERLQELQSLVADKSRVLVATGSEAVELVTVQPEGRRAMSATEWANGRGVAEGDLLGGRS